MQHSGIQDIDMNATIIPFPINKATEPEDDKGDIPARAFAFSQGTLRATSYKDFKEGLAKTAPADIQEYLETIGWANDEAILKEMYAAWNRMVQEKIAAGPLPDPPRRVVVSGIPRFVTSLHELNRQYATYRGQGTLCFVNREESWVLSKKTLLDLLADQVVITGQDKDGHPIYRGAGDVFLANCDKTVYTKMVFHRNADKDSLNLFHGIGVTPKEGDCSLILQHVREVICGNDTERYERFLDLVAWQIQHIGEPSRIITVLYTEKQQAGKGIFLGMLCDIYGPSGISIAEKRHILDKFNSQMKGKAFVFFDESIFGGSIQDANRLKTLSTTSVTSIEPKGLEVISCPIALNFFMASNSKRAAHVEEQDARYWILNCSESRCGDFEYFRSIEKQINEGGKEAFAHFIMNRDVSNFLPQRDTPRDNREKRDMGRECLNPADFRKFLEDCCRSGEIVNLDGALNSSGQFTYGTVTWVPGMKLTLPRMSEAYIKWQRGIHSGQKLESTTSREIGLILKKAGFQKGRESKGDRNWYYIFPSIEECAQALGFEDIEDKDIILEPAPAPLSPKSKNPFLAFDNIKLTPEPSPELSLKGLSTKKRS